MLQRVAIEQRPDEAGVGRGDDLVAEVISCLSEHRIRVTDFRTELPNLEDVFLKLTGHSIRD